MGEMALHITESVRPQAGSVALSLIGLPEALSRHGWDSTVIATDGSCDDGAVPATVSLDQLSARLTECTLVHFHGMPAGFEDIARHARRMRKPYVISPLGAMEPNPYRKRTLRQRWHATWVTRPVVRSAAAVTALNAIEASRLRELGANARIVELPYGLDTATYATEPMSTRRDAMNLLVLGPIHPVEGLVPLLRSAADAGMDAAGWHITLAGPDDGEWRSMLEAAVNRKGGAGRVTFAPAWEPSAQQRLLHNADLLATPSLSVRIPVSVMQASAAGVPVLASPHAVPAGGESATMVCEPTREGLRAGLHAALSLSETDRAARRSHAARLARERYDWSGAVAPFVALYRSLT